MTKLLVNYRADIHVDEDYLLSRAVYNDDYNTVKLLLNNETNIDTLKDAIQTAYEKGYADVVELLKTDHRIINLEACENWIKWEISLFNLERVLIEDLRDFKKSQC